MLKYFCYVKINNIWYRYMDDDVKLLDNVKTETKEYKLEILIYELEQKDVNKNINQNIKQN